MQIRQVISVAFVLVVSGCSTPTPQASFGNAALPGGAVKWTRSGGTLTSLYSFQGEPDGAVPQGPVSVYHGCANVCTAEVIGNTSTGGTNNAGTIYLLFSPDLTTGGRWTERALLSYTPSETGSDPTGSVIARNGYGGPIFGMASQGGTQGKGTAVEIKGTTNAVLSFNGRDGAFPAGGLSPLGHTNFAATSAGGSHDLGAIISITRYKRLRPKVLYSFSGQSDGEHPNSQLTACDQYGCPHYGTTAGSKSVPATVYVFTPGHGLATLYTFANSKDVETPTGVTPYRYYGSSKNVSLFGTTLKGGSSGYGTLFVLKPHGSTYKKVTLHTFAGGTTDGAYPYGPPIFTEGEHPDLYLVTASGGSGGCGTIFSYNFSSAKYTLLYSFTCGADGAYPEAPIVSDVTYGNLYYGTTSAGGTANDGVVFSFNPH
jgi:uncharacterized repeat protein (TIGR03803 family)